MDRTPCSPPPLRFLVAMLIAALAPVRTHAQAASEYEAKAAFLYHFTKFVEWPVTAFSGPASPIRLCVLGDESFGPSLDALQDRQAQGRPITVKRLTSAPATGACHILFISASEERQVPQLLSGLRGQPLLTVGEVEHFAERGGIINLVVEDKRIKMEINLNTAQRRGLKISSQLLRLARVVDGEP